MGALMEPDPATAQAETWASVADALAGVPALVAVTEGPEHELVYTNDAYLEVFGRGGGTGSELAAESSISALDSVYSTGRPHSVRAVPVRLVATDGRTRQGYFTFVYLPLRDPERNVSGVLVVAVDVTSEPRTVAGRRDLRGGPARRVTQPEELDVAVGLRPCGESGGAWHDVVPLGAGRTAIVVGDVREGGGDAAVAVRQLWAALRAYARLDLPPVEVLGLLDELVADAGLGPLVTCGYAVYDPSERSLTYASAGHPPPLLRHADGRSEQLLGGAGAPLGSRLDGFAEEVRTLEDGAVFALYTAGLVRAAGADRLPALLDAEGGTVSARCDAVLAQLPAGDRDEDALLVLVGRHDAGGGRLLRNIELTLNEGREPARRARAFCHGVLSTWQVPDHKREDIVLVVSELVTNAILHGGAAEQLRLRRTARRVVIEVFDNGQRMPHPRAADLKAESGRGLHLVARLADRWGARPVRGGKAVWCEFDTPVPAVSGARRGPDAQALSG